MACRTGCPTQDHANWGECVRASNLQLSTGDANSRRVMTNKAWDAEMNAYQDAVRQGLDPKTTSMKDIVAAKAMADVAGKPVQL